MTSRIGTLVTVLSTPTQHVCDWTFPLDHIAVERVFNTYSKEHFTTPLISIANDTVSLTLKNYTDNDTGPTLYFNLENGDDDAPMYSEFMIRMAFLTRKPNHVVHRFHGIVSSRVYDDSDDDEHSTTMQQRLSYQYITTDQWLKLRNDQANVTARIDIRHMVNMWPQVLGSDDHEPILLDDSLTNDQNKKLQSHPSSSLLSKLYNDGKSVDADVTIALSDQTILQVHRSILRLCSPAFESMIASSIGSLESSSNVIHLEMYSVNAVRTFFRYLYSRSVELAKCESAVDAWDIACDVFHLADQYDQHELMNEMVPFLTKDIPANRFEHLLTISDREVNSSSTDAKDNVVRHLKQTVQAYVRSHPDIVYSSRSTKRKAETTTTNTSTAKRLKIVSTPAE